MGSFGHPFRGPRTVARGSLEPCRCCWGHRPRRRFRYSRSSRTLPQHHSHRHHSRYCIHPHIRIRQHNHSRRSLLSSSHHNGYSRIDCNHIHRNTHFSIWLALLEPVPTPRVRMPGWPLPFRGLKCVSSGHSFSRVQTNFQRPSQPVKVSPGFEGVPGTAGLCL